MTQRPPQPPHSLDAEERALAKSLPRLHGRTAPGPDLDASILAAAQAAVRPSRPALSPARPPVRWIAPAALAASLVLAVSMAWQLRPLPALQAAKPAAQSDASDMVDKPAMQVIEPSPVDIPVPIEQAKPVPLPARVETPARQQVAPPEVGVQEALPAPYSRPMQAPVPLLSPPPPSATPPPPAPPPPPSTMSAEAASGTTSSGILDTQANQRAVRMRTNAAGAAAAKISSDGMLRDATTATTDKAGEADTARQSAAKAVWPATVVRNEAELATDAGFVDDPGMDIPPATAASPAVRDAWLRRIGELLEHGKRQDAKASLAEFRRRYPAAVLPPALHALEIEP
jgi:hypothetical protein